MISEELVVLTDNLTEESGQYGAEYDGVLFIFKSVEERTQWMQTTTPLDIAYIIEAAKSEV